MGNSPFVAAPLQRQHRDIRPPQQPGQLTAPQPPETTLTPAPQAQLPTSCSVSGARPACQAAADMQSEGRLQSGVVSGGEQGAMLSLGEKGLAKAGLVHTVSIVVEPVEPSDSATDDDAVTDDDLYMCKTPTPAEEDMVRSLIMNAELRKEEFAKLLEEHAQIVMEINRAENSLA
ncbi:unnamed protein product [Ixodes persulcatus]